MSWNQIAGYLSKFKIITPPQNTIVETLIWAVFNEVGIKLRKEEVKIQRSVAHLSIDQILKSEIFLGKRKILNTMNKKLGSYKLDDII